MTNSTASVVNNPINLRKKVSILSTAPNSEEKLIAKANQAVEGLSSEFDGWMNENVENLLFAKKKAIDSEFAQEDLYEVFLAAYSILGIADTIKYPLIGVVAQSLCKIFEYVNPITLSVTPLIIQHVDSIHALYHHKVKDDDHPLANKLVKKLQFVTLDFLENYEQKKSESAE